MPDITFKNISVFNKHKISLLFNVSGIIKKNTINCFFGIKNNNKTLLMKILSNNSYDLKINGKIFINDFNINNVSNNFVIFFNDIISYDFLNIYQIFSSFNFFNLNIKEILLNLDFNEKKHFLFRDLNLNDKAFVLIGISILLKNDFVLLGNNLMKNIDLTLFISNLQKINKIYKKAFIIDIEKVNENQLKNFDNIFLFIRNKNVFTGSITDLKTHLNNLNLKNHKNIDFGLFLENLLKVDFSSFYKTKDSLKTLSFLIKNTNNMKISIENHEMLDKRGNIDLNLINLIKYLFLIDINNDKSNFYKFLFIKVFINFYFYVLLIVFKEYNEKAIDFLIFFIFLIYFLSEFYLQKDFSFYFMMFYKLNRKFIKNKNFYISLFLNKNFYYLSDLIFLYFNLLYVDRKNKSKKLIILFSHSLLSLYFININLLYKLIKNKNNFIIYNNYKDNIKILIYYFLLYLIKYNKKLIIIEILSFPINILQHLFNKKNVNFKETLFIGVLYNFLIFLFNFLLIRKRIKTY